VYIGLTLTKRGANKEIKIHKMLVRKTQEMKTQKEHICRGTETDNKCQCFKEGKAQAISEFIHWLGNVQGMYAQEQCAKKYHELLKELKTAQEIE